VIQHQINFLDENQLYYINNFFKKNFKEKKKQNSTLLLANKHQVDIVNLKEDQIEHHLIDIMLE
jgi:hypothetical protein